MKCRKLEYDYNGWVIYLKSCAPKISAPGASAPSVPLRPHLFD